MSTRSAPHHDHSHENMAPRPMLIAVGVLIACVLIFTAFARLTGIGLQERHTFTTEASMSLRFLDEADGGVGVYDAQTGEVVHIFAPETGGFVRVAMRALSFDRAKHGIGDGPAFNLVRTSEGILLLEDTATGRRVTLEAFSAGNAATFGQILDLRETRT